MPIQIRVIGVDISIDNRIVHPIVGAGNGSVTNAIIKRNVAMYAAIAVDARIVNRAADNPSIG
jgi:hypothetical protein